MIPEAAVEAAANRIGPAVTVRDIITILEAAAPHMLAGVTALADAWELQGERDMAFSKTIRNEDISITFLAEGAAKVENARLIRNAIRATK